MNCRKNKFIARDRKNRFIFILYLNFFLFFLLHRMDIPKYNIIIYTVYLVFLSAPRAISIS